MESRDVLVDGNGMNWERDTDQRLGLRNALFKAADKRWPKRRTKTGTKRARSKHQSVKIRPKMSTCSS